MAGNALIYQTQQDLRFKSALTNGTYLTSCFQIDKTGTLKKKEKKLYAILSAGEEMGFFFLTQREHDGIF